MTELLEFIEIICDLFGSWLMAFVSWFTSNARKLQYYYYSIKTWEIFIALIQSEIASKISNIESIKTFFVFVFVFLSLALHLELV